MIYFVLLLCGTIDCNYRSDFLSLDYFIEMLNPQETLRNMICGYILAVIMLYWCFTAVLTLSLMRYYKQHLSCIVLLICILLLGAILAKWWLILDRKQCTSCAYNIYVALIFHFCDFFTISALLLPFPQNGGSRYRMCHAVVLLRHFLLYGYDFHRLSLELHL